MRLLAIALAVFACAGAQAAEIRRYETRVDLDADGRAQATAQVELAGLAPGALRVPVGFARLEEFRAISASPGITLAPGGNGDGAWVDVRLEEGAPPAATLAFAFRSNGMLFVPRPEPGQKAKLPDGSRLVRHRFVNTQEAPIGRYALTVRLPESDRVHAIREQTPKPGRKEFAPRVELDRYEGRQGAMLQLASMRQGDRATMELEVVPARRSILWLLGLLPVAAGYLWFFRDLVARRPAG